MCRSRVISSAIAMVLFSWGQPAAGQGWTLLAPAGSPPARLGLGMAGDFARGRILLFGGYAGTADLNDTWEWDGKDWQQLQPAASPTARRFAGMSFDMRRQRCVLFGGQAGGTRSMETWEWFGGNWNLAAPALSPAPRHGHGQGYDLIRGVTVVFSGLGNNSYENNTWTWDGSSWTQASTAGPIGRIYPAMAFDQRRGVMVLFGGYSTAATPATLNDTWEWDGAVWKQVLPHTKPLERWGAAMCFDMRSGRIVMHGGSQGGNETWAYDGADWRLLSPLAPEPSGRYRHQMAFDTVRKESLLFGGSINDTWSLAVGVLASYRPFGAGCMGTAGVPMLYAAAGSLPRIQASFSIEVGGVPGAAVLLFGRSSASWAGIPLPLALDGLGLTGCRLLVGGETVLPMVAAAGTARLALTIPNDGQLVGLTFFNQALVLDPGANPAGLTLSNGASGVVGR